MSGRPWNCSPPVAGLSFKASRRATHPAHDVGHLRPQPHRAIGYRSRSRQLSPQTGVRFPTRSVPHRADHRQHVSQRFNIAIPSACSATLLQLRLATGQLHNLRTQQPHQLQQLLIGRAPGTRPPLPEPTIRSKPTRRPEPTHQLNSYICSFEPFHRRPRVYRDATGALRSV